MNYLLFQDEALPYSFFVNEKEIVESLDVLLEKENIETEKTLDIVYQPQAVFRVKAITRCTSTIPGQFHPSSFICITHNIKRSRDQLATFGH